MAAFPGASNEPPTQPYVSGSPTQPTVPPDQQETLLASKFLLGAAGKPLGQEFGSYEILGEIGRGGMGIVYKARQKTLDRLVALKTILPGGAASDDDLQRFRVEAEAAARLQHPNIVAVHEIGLVDGQHFYSMDFIDGPSLSQRLRDGPLPGRAAARYAMIIARAMHHAHKHNILHRDLKPSNVLLDGADQPHITDFGLAKKLGGDSSQTHTGAVLGTPSYMAPEQAAGKNKELGPPCDVYGIGALLYELLTGQPIFLANTPVDTLQRVLEDEPVAPCFLNPRIDRDLETICLKCVQKDPRERYPTAEALAEDLLRYLNGDSIAARSFNVIDRLARTLDHSQVAGEFHTWERMLLIFAGVIFLGHLILFFLVHSSQPRYWIKATRMAQFVVIGGVFWRFRSRTVLPTSAAERQLWTIWIGYLLAYVINALVVRELAGPQHWDELAMYPFSAVLTGTAFFVMGSSYWGRCYLIGLAFFGLAALMPIRLDWAPLALGAFWAGALGSIAYHVRHSGGEQEPIGDRPA